MSTDARAALRAILTRDAGVTALVGTRIYPGRAPQGATLPRLVYRMSGEEGVPSLADPPTDGGLTSPRFVVEAFADTQDGGATLGRATRAALEGARGVWSDQAVRLIRVTDASESEEALLDASEQPVYVYTLQAQMWRTAAPEGVVA